MKRFPPISSILILTFIALFLCPTQLRGTPNVSLTLEGKSIIAGRPFYLELDISWEGEPEQYLVENPRLTPPQGITLTSSSYSTSAKGNSYLLHYQYSLYAESPGTYVFEPLKISYWEDSDNGVQTLRTDALTVKVRSWAESALARFRVPGALLLIFISLFITAFVFSKKKKKADRHAQTPGVSTGAAIADELKQCRLFKISGEWGNYLNQVISIRCKLGTEENNEKALDELRTLAEKVHYGSYRPTAEEINHIQRQLEKACSSVVPGGDNNGPRKNGF